MAQQTVGYVTPLGYLYCVPCTFARATGDSLPEGWTVVWASSYPHGWEACDGCGKTPTDTKEWE